VTPRPPDLVKSGAVKSVKDLKAKKIATAGGAGTTGSYLVTGAWSRPASPWPTWNW
jgi:hypothetical protein